jgi:hypothetical protein
MPVTAPLVGVSLQLICHRCIAGNAASLPFPATIMASAASQCCFSSVAITRLVCCWLQQQGQGPQMWSGTQENNHHHHHHQQQQQIRLFDGLIIPR